MSATRGLIVIVPGANGRSPGIEWFGGGSGSDTRFAMLTYPGWQRYIAGDFSADTMISELADRVAAVCPQGPIWIIGISLGGHFGYAMALRLQSSGRAIAGFCAVDTFAVSSAAPRPGWQRRALSLAVHLLQNRRLKDLTIFVRTRFWRALLRLPGHRLRYLLDRFTYLRWLASRVAREPLFDEELSARLLLQEVAPWVGSLDIDPVPLEVPALFIRTAESNAGDAAWRRRCPAVKILETPGTHQTMFDLEYLATFRERFLAGARSWYAGAVEG